MRLYRNGVFHSQFNSRNPISATPWSLLLLPAYFRKPGAIRRALVLGVGGGAVVRLLQHCVQPEEIVGVEVDPVHISIARRFFGVKPHVADLVHADAVDWLGRYRGPKFDLIIDDLYGESAGEPVRVVPSDRRWLSLLTKHLSTDGVLVINFIDTKAHTEASRLLIKQVSNSVDAGFRLTLPAYENRIGAFVNQRLAANPLRRSLRSSTTPCVEALAMLPFRIHRVSI